MMTYTKEELLKNATPYFSQGEKVMFATDDGNYFYEHAKHHAHNHTATSKAKLHTLTKEEFDNLESVSEDNNTTDEAPKRGRKPSKS